MPHPFTRYASYRGNATTMRTIITSVPLIAFLVSAGCGLGEIRSRQKALEPLLATNASLSAVESNLGDKFDITKRGSPEWDRMMTNYSAYSTPHYHRLTEKMRKSAAVGYTTTISMVTWIFLDADDKLTDFEVDAQ